MSIEEFAKEYGISIVVCAEQNNKEFNIIKSDSELEKSDLFKQLIVYNSADNLLESIKGQMLPRIWTQDDIKCVMSKPNEEQVVAMFYKSNMDAKENYFFAKQLDEKIKEIWL